MILNMISNIDILNIVLANQNQQKYQKLNFIIYRSTAFQIPSRSTSFVYTITT